MIDLASIWAGLIAFAILAYVILDGFDLGVGILFSLFREDDERTAMTNSVAPVWDGNETWLVLGGGGLLAVFPEAYATILSALYLPVVAMLLGLVFRGVAFEFRWRTKRWRPLWNVGFMLGSMTAALAQGLALGALVTGLPQDGVFGWLTPFGVLTAAALMIGYALLGATWLNMKTTGAIQAKARRLAYPLAVTTLVLIAVISLWTPFIHRQYFERWFGWPTAFFSALVPLLLAICLFVLWRGLSRHRHYSPFLAALGIFILSYAGLGISFYPYIIPGRLTFEQAAAPEASLAFLLAGAGVLVPVILIYTAYAYWVFRGKIGPEESYH